MERFLYQNLVAWKNNSKRKPLMLEGARQVGKTYLLKQFGEQEYEHFYYLNFDETPEACTLFAGSIGAESILNQLSIYFQRHIDPATSLICFDEIQECDSALASLKYFCEDAPQYHVVAAGSLLGVKLKNNKGFPVGKVTLRQLWPLSFMEFLLVIDKQGWVDLLQHIKPGERIPDIFHQGLTEALKTYFYVGGMPEAVNYFRGNYHLQEIRQVQKDILRTYELDFAKHASPADAAKISLIWDTVPSQLAKENKKFIYSVVKESARAREYESAIQWLVDANLILKCYNIAKPAIPLKSYANHDVFKTYMHDTGLLGAMNQLKLKALLTGNQLFQEYKGAMTENYVAQCLTYNLDHPLYYWSSQGKAEVDFIVDIEGTPVPIEVKSSATKQKRSLQIYRDKYKPPLAIRVSPMNLSRDNSFLNVPLYALDQLPRFIEEAFCY